MSGVSERVEIRRACLMCPDTIRPECRGPCSPHPTVCYITWQTDRGLFAEPRRPLPCTSDRGDPQAAQSDHVEAARAAWRERAAIHVVDMTEALDRRRLARLADAAEAALAIAEDQADHDGTTDRADGRAVAALAVIADLLRGALAPIRAAGEAPPTPFPGDPS